MRENDIWLKILPMSNRVDEDICYRKEVLLAQEANNFRRNKLFWIKYDGIFMTVSSDTISV